MKEDYVSFELAKLLKEKGFDEKCRAIYEDGVLHIQDEFLYNSDSDKKLIEGDEDDSWVFVTAPTLQMAMKWLREKHKIFIDIGYNNYYNEYKWVLFTMDRNKDITPHFEYNYDSYESACEAAIEWCLTNLIK